MAKKTTKIRKIVKLQKSPSKKRAVISASKVQREHVSISKEKYFEAVGKRKTAIARVRLYPQRTDILVNEKDYCKYFPVVRLQKTVTAPFRTLKIDKIGATIKVQGGGVKAQAEAIRLGIARALVLYNPNFRKRLKQEGYLTRDSRVVERKKYGLKKARRAPQWQKR